MKCLLTIVCFLFAVCELFAQADTSITPRELQKAPEELQQFLSNIQQEKSQKTTRDAELEIDGLLINNTRSKNGNDFYEFFYRNWVPPKQASNYSIYISELPYRLSTTKIEIKINETLVFQSFMQPRSDLVEELAKQARSRTYMYLQNFEEIKKQLEGSDRSGSGIY